MMPDPTTTLLQFSPAAVKEGTIIQVIIQT